ncbi:MAG TPA: CPBP family glutamic-type intramembrane protease, partial [Terracidiphilus sp.]|nr:CPBP family glutamic-type intramembrane protease [Terracidiphilus sp.]
MTWPASPDSPTSPEDNPPRPWPQTEEPADAEPSALNGPIAPGHSAAPRFESADLSSPERIPNFGHLILLLVLVGFGALLAGILSQIALHRHLFGVTSLQEAVTDVHYALGSEAILYLASLAACLIVFPLIWQKGFFSGIQWNFMTAWRLRWRLVAAAFACFVLALLNTVIVPGPSKTPIEKIFRTPGAAWLLFAFGVTFAPFFEETFFRGFLLPAFCTCYDWIAERAAGSADLRTDLRGRAHWPASAQIAAAFITAIPFAGLCSFPRSHDIPHIAVRILVVLAWLAGIGLAW